MMKFGAEVFAMWNAIGPLVGVVIGALLTPWVAWHWQRKQWMLDNKKQEYRDLLDGLLQASDEIIDARPSGSIGVSPKLSDERQLTIKPQGYSRTPAEKGLKRAVWQDVSISEISPFGR